MLCDELAKRLADTNFQVYNKDLIATYINSSMSKLLSDAWISSEGDKDKLAKVFPELLKLKSIQTDGEPVDIKEAIAGNCFVIVSAITAGKHVRIWENSIYHQVIAGKSPYHNPTAQQPAMFNIDDRLIILPKIEELFEVLYIITPSKNDGTNYMYDDEEFVKLNPKWFPQIIDLAESFARKDMQETV